MGKSRNSAQACLPAFFSYVDAQTSEGGGGGAKTPFFFFSCVSSTTVLYSNICGSSG
jgi:hypothetical protein